MELLFTMGGLVCTAWVLFELARLPHGARAWAFDNRSGRRLQLRVERRGGGRRRADRVRTPLPIELSRSSSPGPVRPLLQIELA